MENLLNFVLTELRNPDRHKPVKQIAEEAGVPYFTIQKWMRSEGTRNPRIDSVQRLADYFRQQARQNEPERKVS